ncbi:MAG: GntR family transcriptional regulator [Pseudomonadota bacterium]
MKTLSQQITEDLREKILSGELAPNEHLEEIPLAQKLNVSRTPLRGALNALANQGLLVYRPKLGYLVRNFEIEEIIAAYEVRANLEGLACRLAARIGFPEDVRESLQKALYLGDEILARGNLAERDMDPYKKMNVEIHEAIIQASNNPWISQFVERAQEIPFVSSHLIIWNEFPIISRSHDDHHRIIDAINRKQGARAEEIMREHIYFAGEYLKKNFNSMKPTPRDELDHSAKDFLL